MILTTSQIIQILMGGIGSFGFSVLFHIRGKKLLLAGLGGKDNIESLDCCATRLRVTVKDENLVSENLLKQSGARGVIQKGAGVQVIYGPQVSVIKSELEDYIKTLE